MNARGIPPAVYWVLLLLSYLGTPPRPDLAGGGGYPAGGGYPGQVPPHPDLAGGLPWSGTPPSWPGRGGTLVRYPPVLAGGGVLTRVPPWQGTPPWLDLVGLPPLAGPGRVPPPSVCPMAFWEMLQSIMGYGYPPCGRTDWWMDGRTDSCQNITFPSYYVRGR